MRSSIITLGLAVIIGVVIGLLLQSPEPATNSFQSLTKNTARSSAETHPPEITELAQQLQREIIAREALQKEVTTLSQKLASLYSEKFSGKSSGKNQQTNGSQKSSVSEQAGAAHKPTESAWFNQQALIDAGMSQAEAEQLKSRFEKLELEKLYLRDQAVREGWSGGKRYRDEREKLETQADNIKQELGDDAYDAYLFASGQPNRVSVQSVLSGSAAGNAGMLSGDQVIRYDGERIYNWRDLRTATSQGDLTETIAIQVLRENKQMEFYVQRGPLGIRMTSVSIAPQP